MITTQRNPRTMESDVTRAAEDVGGDEHQLLSEERHVGPSGVNALQHGDRGLPLRDAAHTTKYLK